MEREIRGWSQARIAEAVNTSVRSVIRWEQGKVLPQPFYREQLCTLFGKNAQELGIQSAEIPPSLRPVTVCPIEHPLLATKINPPFPAHTIIQRPRLTNLLTFGNQKRLTLISAPAGSGKTTAITEWIKATARTDAVAWVSLDNEDTAPERFWLYVLTSINIYQANLYAPLIAILRAQPIHDWYTFLKYVLNTLLKSERPITLVLDNYHCINNSVTHDTVAYFLEHLPLQHHLIISTRNDPPWSLSRLRAQGAIRELRGHQLNGTEEEVEAFFSQVLQVQHPRTIIAEITQRTEGWFAAIQLLAPSLYEVTNSTNILNLLDGSQRPIFDYIIEEIFSQQSPAMQEFLLQTSILERLDTARCDAVRNKTDSQKMLDRLERANLIIVLDQQQQWYRYQHLFAQALRAYLRRTSDEQTIQTFYKRANISECS
ncbi:hypothetical protein [Dictyobacter aurantiacus]|uniref:HTH cro/C1-type domain-containing protein n=1 Tax=Dictyobacter aurantiacus TaxID=1936993 RepID=A0A401ZT61_9CHLR|nr:hypothetical protein [Dictyobacter aurantiacus]GCE10079.1 hypothetical protein KDAU_74080 [Dictyobacter aurantiacus]